MNLTFTQIKALTEKYAPTMMQLDALSDGIKAGSPMYFDALHKMKLAVVDQFVKEVVKQVQGNQPPSNVPAVNSEQ